MKKLLLLVACLLALGCAKKVSNKLDMCEKIKTEFQLPELETLYNQSQFDEYMFYAGWEISIRMQAGQNPACALVHIKHNISITDDPDWVVLAGSYCAEIRDDGNTYFCDYVCTYDATTGEPRDSQDHCEEMSW